MISGKPEKLGRSGEGQGKMVEIEGNQRESITPPKSLENTLPEITEVMRGRPEVISLLGLEPNRQGGMSHLN